MEEKPLPLGLSLEKSKSLIDLVERKVYGENGMQRQTHDHQHKATGKRKIPAEKHKDKMKASNFPADLLRIGTWEKLSVNEGDIIAKFYFAKRTLVWEILDNGLKRKFQIHWDEISAINADFNENQSSVFQVELYRPPSFFEERNPQPRRHTLWQHTTDFTGGQATTYRIHHMEFAQGTLRRPFEKLIGNYETMRALSQTPFSTSHPVFQSILIHNIPNNHGPNSENIHNNIPPHLRNNILPTQTAGNNHTSQSQITTTNPTPPINMPHSNNIPYNAASQMPYYYHQPQLHQTPTVHPIPINPTLPDMGFQNSGIPPDYNLHQNTYVSNLQQNPYSTNVINLPPRQDPAYSANVINLPQQDPAYSANVINLPQQDPAYSTNVINLPQDDPDEYVSNINTQWNYNLEQITYNNNAQQIEHENPQQNESEYLQEIPYGNVEHNENNINLDVQQIPHESLEQNQTNNNINGEPCHAKTLCSMKNGEGGGNSANNINRNPWDMENIVEHLFNDQSSQTNQDEQELLEKMRSIDEQLNQETAEEYSSAHVPNNGEMSNDF